MAAPRRTGSASNPHHSQAKAPRSKQQLADAAPIWAEIAAKHNLAEPDLNRLTSAWHTDADLGRPIEVVTDMSKSRKLGFLDYQPTDDSFFDLFTRLRRDHIIP